MHATQTVENYGDPNIILAVPGFLNAEQPLVQALGFRVPTHSPAGLGKRGKHGERIIVLLAQLGFANGQTATKIRFCLFRMAHGAV